MYYKVSNLVKMHSLKSVCVFAFVVDYTGGFLLPLNTVFQSAVVENAKKKQFKFIIYINVQRK